MTLSPEALVVIEEEEAILRRVCACLTSARPAAHAAPADALTELRALREEASATAEDDLPPLLLEMSVRRRLLDRPVEPLLPSAGAPYLAHLRVKEHAAPPGGPRVKDYLLGHVSHIDPSRDVRIVDWRIAPVAQIFYRYREGDEYEETFPGRVVEGVIEARRIVVIERGELVQIVSDELVLTRDRDGVWQSGEVSSAWLEPGGAGVAARPGILGVGVGRDDRPGSAGVTALLDATQFAAISAPAEEPLLVIGSAGSGKTTVALHRLARIAAQEPSRFPLSQVKVVVPEEGLARLARRLLAPVTAGAGEVAVETLDAWAYALACRVFGGAPPKICVDPPALVSSLKRHPALFRALERRFARLDPKATTLRRLRRRLTTLFTDRAFLAGVVADSRGTLPEPAVEDTVRHTMLQLAEPLEEQLAAIVVPEMRAAIDGRPIWEATPDELAGTLDAEDLPILLFLRAWRAGLDVPSVAHLVLDEAEDLSLFELFVFAELLGEQRSVTLAGDEAQQTSSSFAGWEASLATLRAQGAATCRLAVSYRCPRPIAELARGVLGALAPDEPARAARDGAPVGRFHFPDDGQAQLFINRALRELVEREPRASIAVIAREPDAARKIGALLESRLVLRGEFTFEPGVDVTDVDNAKGLEFDYVIVPDASAEAYPATDEARRRLHVAVTRAAHQLWIVSSGVPSPLAPSPLSSGACPL